ncbi:asparaginase [Alteribacter keqinensis]|uniref:Uncharacterized protein n=1 Tax=Alteribacter keqinensis TaxID=2483800 RepID=A0A3M7TZF5_9BACI|nr:asparaginase [Alteribacter keqinensis]RNA70144.1 hypothetical protein EBO34_09505 [Alteribacter keqinensis]
MTVKHSIEQGPGQMGHLAVYHSLNGCQYKEGNGGVEVNLPSLLQPFYALPLLTTGAAEAYLLTDRELAVCCGVQYDSPLQKDIELSLLFRFGIEPDEFYAFTDDHTSLPASYVGKAGLAMYLQHDWRGVFSRTHPVSQMTEQLLSRWSGEVGRFSVLGVSRMFSTLGDVTEVREHSLKRAIVKLSHVMGMSCGPHTVSAGISPWQIWSDHVTYAGIWVPGKKAGAAVYAPRNHDPLMFEEMKKRVVNRLITQLI